MLLSELAMATGLRYEGEDTDIVSIEYDSRKVKKGSLFCCIVGSLLDGHTFAESALQNGATALVVERELPLNVPQLVVKNARKAMAEMAAALLTAAACLTCAAAPCTTMRPQGVETRRRSARTPSAAPAGEVAVCTTPA